MSKTYTKSGFAWFVLTLIRILQLIAYALLLIISGYYFVITIDAIGDDIDVHRETHLTHDRYGHHMFGITNSDNKEDHITSLIIWVVITMMAAIFSTAGIIGTIWINPCLVLFSAIMILLFAVSGIVLPDIGLTLPEITSNYSLLVLEVIAVVLSVMFVIILNRWGLQKRTVPHKEVTFA
ncbi:uncharacterized protein LOC128964145 [Oppia nitens]|uniref:uncharacterized protein LOC128964145 n=1 Tax=Oppia nitens TaxID=1686743 RepID=UPI0023D9E18B|nr:uncharacterized protein LOC128964145 [Oppia nitens]